MDPIAFLFPGQGSQAVGMGRALAERYRLARETFAEADAALGFALSTLCFEGPAEQLTLTEHTQPALLTHSVALARVLDREVGVRPAWAAGHSLGEFSALVVAGALSFADAVRVVRERGRAMQEAVPVGVGAMAAVLGADVDAVVAACAEAAQGEVVAPANLNGPGQVVIAGHKAAVERAGAIAKTKGARRVAPLPVSAPFHCALMGPAARRLEAVLAEVSVEPPAIPVISNVTAEPYADAESVRRLLVQQVTTAVRWQDCAVRLAQVGCRRALEVGPGKVLTGLVKRIAPEIECLPAEDVDEVRRTLAA
jgi:[acyl-carrier-protein] S-malonyltransferase